jgi:hypothetical protein
MRPAELFRRLVGETSGWAREDRLWYLLGVKHALMEAATSDELEALCAAYEMAVAL